MLSVTTPQQEKKKRKTERQHTDIDTIFALRRLANAVCGFFLALGALALPVDQILVVRRLFRAQCWLRLQRRVWPLFSAQSIVGRFQFTLDFEAAELLLCVRGTGHGQTK